MIQRDIAGGASRARRQPVLAMALSLILAFGMAPAAAWADGDEVSVAESATTQSSASEEAHGGSSGNGALATPLADGVTAVAQAAAAEAAGDGEEEPSVEEERAVSVRTMGIARVHGTPDSASFRDNTLGFFQDGAIDENGLTVVGKFQFNIAGNTVTTGKYEPLLGTPFNVDPEAEAAVGYKLSPIGGVSVGHAGTDFMGSYTNSSTAKLVQTSDSTKIFKAYLLVTASQRNVGNVAAKAPMSHYGVCLKGPKGTIERYYPEIVYQDGAGQRASCYFDVTDFVKEQGYGTYTGINVPFSDINGTAQAAVGSDCFGGWKLIVIEENPDLESTRMVRLKLGGTAVNPKNKPEVVISGDGLMVAPNPTGELLVSMDGTDLDNAYQALQSGAGAQALDRVRLGNVRPFSNFFSFTIGNKDRDMELNPASRTVAGKYPNFPATHQTFNTDFCVAGLEELERQDGQPILSGGETSFTVKTDSSTDPTLMSAVGLVADIVVPEFATTFTIANQTRTFATSEPGYSPVSHYAQAGDALHATMRCENVSDEDHKHLGLHDATITVELPAFATIDEGSIVARYKAVDGSEQQLRVVSVKGTTITVQAVEDTTISRGGYFELIADGTAKGTASYTEYENRVAIGGAFVDDNQHIFTDLRMDSLGVAYATTASDIPRHEVETSVSGKGEVTVTGSDREDNKFEAGEEATVTWEPEEGQVVKGVIVDGVMRDDLIDAGSVSFPVGEGGHSVHVVFGDPDPAPDPDDEPASDRFTVSTAGDRGLASLTPTQMVRKGSDHAVTWETKPGFEVAEIYLDGFSYPASDRGSIEFTNVGASHRVEILTVEVLPPARFASVQTVAKGPGTISPSVVVAAGTDHKVTWTPAADAEVARVFVDGTLVFDKYSQDPNPDLRDPAPLERLFSKLTGDHQVSVEFVAKTPSADPTPTILLTTQILGGPGTITPSMELEVGASPEVAWTVTNAAGDTYAVERVVLFSGTTRHEFSAADIQAGKVSLANLTADATLQVVLSSEAIKAKPSYRIETALVGGAGSISGSATDVVAGEDRAVSWSAPEGYRVTSVIVDGVVRDDLLAAGGVTFENVQADHRVLVSVQADTGSDKEQFYTVTVVCEGGGTAGPSAVVRPGTSHEVTWKSFDGDDVAPLSVKVDGIKRDDLLAAGGVTFASIGANHTVVVVFPEATGATNYFTVTTELAGGPGFISGSTKVPAGVDHRVEWEPAAGYSVERVLIDDEAVSLPPARLRAAGIALYDLAPAGDAYTFEAIDADHVVHIDLKAEMYTVTTAVMEGQGTVSPTATVAARTDHEVSWTPAAGWRVARIVVDGADRADLRDAGKVLFADVLANHSVEVYFELDQEPPYDPDDHLDLDTDGDGKPDVNIDTDGDGKADVNVDTDGDGKPDLNVDADGDGKPDVNIDTDGDHKPDVNLDTDGDGKPDLNVDTDGDGNPDLNIDTDGDGKPDVNVDTDGDGKPDLFIDVDGDGIPDVNIDTDGDGKPDVNIDVDGDGVPDWNIDTDSTGIWKPSSQGGNADGVWKADKNLLGTGKGPGSKTQVTRLAQTGDETTLTTLVVFGCALAGAVVVFAALRARRRGAVL
ncbi:hypothetical protein [Adlercreutzia muris]|uniref:hypothetical protein n=1 Tax=Adlercreutzia muris TaxID=1796610 RepID=UPI0023ED04C5|nr:hypothetical protein [Adlercreutzia muris]